jgi:hypothetical protein
MGICDLVLEKKMTVVAMRLLASDDADNCDMRYPQFVIDGITEKETRPRKAGQLRNQLTFTHGECHLQDWHSDENEERARGDRLDIPDYLRREAVS